MTQKSEKGMELDKLSVEELVHKIKGNPGFIEECGERVREFGLEHWLYLLEHRPNDQVIVNRFDRWDECKADVLCRLLCAHPSLSSACPDRIWRRFKRGHWAMMVKADRILVDKLDELGMTAAVSDGWCCVHHWAEEYMTLFAQVASALSPAEKVREIAENSAMNPNYEWSGHCAHYSNDIQKHMQWLATVAKDFAEMAADAEVESAERYSLIAQAAAYQSKALLQRLTRT